MKNKKNNLNGVKRVYLMITLIIRVILVIQVAIMVFGLITTVFQTESGKFLTERQQSFRIVLVVAILKTIMRVMKPFTIQVIVAEISSR